MAIWRELEAQGVRRCSAMFTNGKQCRRRAIAEWDNSWCAKHGPVIKKHTDFAMRAVEAQLRDDEATEEIVDHADQRIWRNSLRDLTTLK